MQALKSDGQTDGQTDTRTDVGKVTSMCQPNYEGGAETMDLFVLENGDRLFTMHSIKLAGCFFVLLYLQVLDADSV